MEKKRRSLILTLALTLALCFIAAFTFLLFPTSPTVAFADANEDANTNMKHVMSNYGPTIQDGAMVSLDSPYVLAWNVNITTNGIQQMEQAIIDAYEEKKDDYVWFDIGVYTLQTRLLIFEASKLPTLSPGLTDVAFDYDEGIDADLLPVVEYTELDGPHLKIGNNAYYPEYDLDITPIAGREYVRVALPLTKDDIGKDFVPIALTYGGYYTAGIFNVSAYSFDYGFLSYNSNAVRSIQYVSNAAYEADPAADPAEIKILMQNMGNTQVVEELEANETFQNLLESNPLNLTIKAGAEHDKNRNGIKWTCTLNAANYNEWKSIVGKVTLWWVVVDFTKYTDTGDPASDLKYNIGAAERVYAEVELTQNGNLYEASIVFDVEDYRKEYTAIPYVKAVGVKPSASTKIVSEYQDVASGTYVTCLPNDNARSLNSLTGDDGEYTYNFTYLEALEDKPFAIKQTKTVTLDSRLNFDTMKMKDYADILGIDTNDKGEIECLMSHVEYWYIKQSTIDNYNINALYSLIPLTFRNESGDTKMQVLGLIPFTNIDGKNEYSKLITSLKDKEGKSYFERIDDVAVGDLYGYFYTYSYESESKDPNWQIDKEQYNGSIVYFTELEEVENKIGYMEIGTYGSILSAVTGAIVGTIIGGPSGMIVGIAAGAVGGYTLSATAASLFGCEQDSETIYHHVEYGFLDCTNMLPSNYYDTEEDPELQIWETIALIAVAVFELYLILSFNAKFKMPLIARLIVIAALIGLCVWGDIALYQFFLS